MAAVTQSVDRRRLDQAGRRRRMAVPAPQAEQIDMLVVHQLPVEALADVA